MTPVSRIVTRFFKRQSQDSIRKARRQSLTKQLRIECMEERRLLAFGAMDTPIEYGPALAAEVSHTQAYGPALASGSTQGNDSNASSSNANPSTQASSSQPQVDLALSKEIGGGSNSITSGAALTYRLQVTNVGSADATNVLLTDTLPNFTDANVTLQSVSSALGAEISAANPSSSELNLRYANLAAGQSDTIFVTLRFPAEVGAATVFSSASISSNQADANPANNQTFAILNVSPSDSHASSNETSPVSSEAMGESTPMVEFTHDFVDRDGNPIAGNQVVVGDRFSMRTFVRDTRTGFTNPPRGVVGAYLDVGFDDAAVFDIDVGEVQQLRFFVDKLDTAAINSSFTLDFGAETTDSIFLIENGQIQQDSQIARQMESALENLSTVGTGNVTVQIDTAASRADAVAGNARFNFEIRFIGDLTQRDLPTITLNPTNVSIQGGESFDFEVNTVLNGDQSTPESEYLGVTYNEAVYTFAANFGEVLDARFNDFGASSELTNSSDFPSPGSPTLLYTIPMIATAPGVVNFTPAEGDNSPVTDILIQTPGVGVAILTEVVPPAMVDFGSTFSLSVVLDANAPTALNDAISVAEDSTITFNGNITNNDVSEMGRTLQINSVSTIQSTQGSVDGLVYTPPQDFFGTDLVMYTIIDGDGFVSGQATVTITVNPVNDAPVAMNDNLFIDENSIANILDVLANDNGGPNEASDTLTITNATTATGTVTFASGSNILYTPPIDFIGSATIDYTIQDQGGLTASASVTVTVEPTVLPRAVNDQVTTEEDGAGIEIDVLANDRANAGAMPTLVSATQPQNGSVSIDDKGTGDLTDDTIRYTPNENFNGTDTFAYTLNDTSGLGAGSVGTVTVTVTNVNDPPVIADDSVETNEDTELTIPISTLLANDSPGVGEGPDSQNPQTLAIDSVTIIGGDPVAFFTSDSTGIIYTPPADFFGTKEFTYIVRDGDGLSGTGTVTVTINSVNDAPVAGGDTASTNEDTPVSVPVSSLLVNDSAGPTNEGQTALVTSVAATTEQGGTASLTDGNITYTPAADFNGTDLVVYTISDGDLTSTGTLTINVAPVNDPPIAGDDTATTIENTQVTIPVSTLLSNDVPGPAADELEGANLTAAALAISGLNGDVRFNSDRSAIIYTPPADVTGTRSFTYTIDDGTGLTDQGTVTVTINPNPGVDLTVTTTAGAEQVLTESNLIYNFRVTNNGPATATNVIFLNSLPSSLKFISAQGSTGTVTEQNGVLTVIIDSLAEGEFADISLLTEVLSTPSGTLTNIASVSSDQEELNQTDNAASDEVEVELIFSRRLLHVTEETSTANANAQMSSGQADDDASSFSVLAYA